MSRTAAIHLRQLRPSTLWSSVTSLSQQAIASSSSTSHFSTSSPAFASRAKQVAKRKKANVLALRSSRRAEDAHPPDPVLGHVPSATDSRAAYSISSDPNPSSSSSSAGASARGTNPWEGCRLQRTVLTPEQVWSAPHTSTPQHYLPGLSSADADVLFGAVPHTTLTLGTRDISSHDKMMKEVEDQEKQVGAIQRILDLRNASKAGIEVMNRQRIIEEFGRKRVVDSQGQSRFEGEPQSGGSEVQAALLTQKIRNLHLHLTQNPRDIHNKRPLRTLVHQRAKILKYLKRTQPTHYDLVLRDLGLERRAVEGELIV